MINIMFSDGMFEYANENVRIDVGASGVVTGITDVNGHGLAQGKMYSYSSTWVKQ